MGKKCSSYLCFWDLFFLIIFIIISFRLCFFLQFRRGRGLAAETGSSFISPLSICLLLHTSFSLSSWFHCCWTGLWRRTRTETAVPHSAKRSTARLIRDDRLREMHTPCVVVELPSLSKVYQLATTRASTARWGHTLQEPHLHLRLSTWFPSVPLPLRPCLFNCVFTDPCPALTTQFCNKAHMSRRRWLVSLHRSPEYVA